MDDFTESIEGFATGAIGREWSEGEVRYASFLAGYSQATARVISEPTPFQKDTEVSDLTSVLAAQAYNYAGDERHIYLTCSSRINGKTTRFGTREIDVPAKKREVASESGSISLAAVSMVSKALDTALELAKNSGKQARAVMEHNSDLRVELATLKTQSDMTTALVSLADKREVSEKAIDAGERLANKVLSVIGRRRAAAGKSDPGDCPPDGAPRAKWNLEQANDLLADTIALAIGDSTIMQNPEVLAALTEFMQTIKAAQEAMQASRKAVPPPPPKDAATNA